MNKVEFPDFHVFTLYMIFEILLKMAIPIMPIFSKKFENHMQGKFVKIREFTRAIIFVVFIRKLQARLKNESFKISRNSPLFIMHYHMTITKTNYFRLNMENSQEWSSKVSLHFIKEDFCHCIGTKKLSITSSLGKNMIGNLKLPISHGQRHNFQFQRHSNSSNWRLRERSQW